LLGHLGATAGRGCFGFLLRRVALRFCLVLLGLALASEVVTTGHRTGGFLGPALHVLDDALHGFSGSRFVVRHGLIPLSSAYVVEQFRLKRRSTKSDRPVTRRGRSLFSRP